MSGAEGVRFSRVERTTRETSVTVEVWLDGPVRAEISTGIGFFDHMLELFARHGLMGLVLRAQGDLHVDYHHTVEDVGIVLGQAMREALGDKAGIARYGSILLPMDEALAQVAVDCSGRGFICFTAPEGLGMAGTFSFQLVEEFWRAFAMNAGLTLHVDVLRGRDAHHVAEAVFKGVARALRQAVALDPREMGVPSTKGSLQG